MTKPEAEKIIKILMEADGGCPSCTQTLIELFVEQFPEYKDIAIQAWEAEHAELQGAFY